MKKGLTAIGLLFLTSTGICQSDTISDFNLLDKGENVIGLAFTVGWGGSGIVGSINLRYGLFLMKQLNGGLDIEYSSSGKYFKSIKAGPYIRYYFLNKIFSPVIEMNYHFAGYRFDYLTETSHEIRIGYGIALSGLIKRKLGLELLGVYKIEFINTNTTNNFGPAFRFSYHF